MVEHGNERHVIVRLPGEGLRGTTSTGRPLVVRVTGAQTGGRIGVVELDEEPRLEVTVHVHESDEAWYILAGEYRLFAGRHWFPAPAGTFIFVPGGTPHGFAVLSGDPARKLSFSLPGGLEEAYLPTESQSAMPAMPTPLGTVTLPANAE